MKKSMEEFVDFYFYLLKEEQDETLWDLWLHAQTDKSFEEFKRESLKRDEIKLTKNEGSEAERLEWAAGFIKPVDKVVE